MPEIKLVAEPRTQFGKGAARKIRRDHKIPAVLYGHGTAPVHITLPGHDTMMALKTANALLSIEIDGDSQLALAKDVQRDPIKPVIEHVDLVVVRRDEKVTVDVPVTTRGRGRRGDGRHRRLPDRPARGARDEHPPARRRLRRGPRGRHPGAGRPSSTCPRAPSWSPTGDTSSSTSPSRSPPRRSRPSWPRPRPRPASSTRRPTRPRRGGRGARVPRARVAEATTRRGRRRRRSDRRVLTASAPGSVPSAWIGPERSLARRRARQPRTGVCRQPPQRRSHGRPRARAPATTSARCRSAGWRRRRDPAALQGASGPRAGRRGPARAGPAAARARVVLAVPTTFMNESGGPVAALLAYYSVDLDHLVVVHDELDIPAGDVRLKRGGGEGGHNGLRSVSRVPRQQGLPAGPRRDRPTARTDGSGGLRAPRLLGRRAHASCRSRWTTAADAVESLVTSACWPAQQRFHAGQRPD